MNPTRGAGDRSSSPAYSPLRLWYTRLSLADLVKEREKLHEMTHHRQCHKPIPQLIAKLNRRLKGWKNHFDFGYPRQAFRGIDTFVRYRLTQHLRRRSQRVRDIEVELRPGGLPNNPRTGR